MVVTKRGKKKTATGMTKKRALLKICGYSHSKGNNHQLDATYYFIVLLIGSTCFEHYYAHHQELATIMFITTLIVSFLVCCRLEVRCG